MSFNELLAEAGEFGRYQKFLCFGFLCPSIAAVAFTFWSQVFILLSPPHRCRLTSSDTWDNNVSLYESVIVKDCDVHFDASRNDSLPYLQQWISTHPSAHGSNNSTWVSTPCPNGYVYDFSVHYPTITTEQSWLCGDSWKMYTIHTCYWAGAVCGFCFFGIFSDRFGRKRALQTAMFLMLVAEASTVFANSFISFAVLRFLSAMGRGTISTIAFLLGMEYTGPSGRVLVLGAWCFSWAATSAFVPVVPYLLRSWRRVLGISIIPCSTVLFISYFIPESASWLITRDRTEEAAKLMHRLASVNGKNLSLDYIKQRLQIQEDTVDHHGKTKMKLPSPNGCDGNEPKITKRSLTYSEALIGLFKTPNMRKKTILLIIVWMIAASCYNGISIEMSNLPFNVYLSYSIGAILEMPPKVFCLLALDRIGRRWANFGFFVVAGVVGLIIFLFKPGAHVVFALAMVVRSGQATVFDITTTFCSESFPTAVRGWGISLIRISGGISSAVAPLIVSLAEYDPLLPLGVFGLLSLLAGIATLFIPETAKQHLPHTLEEGEAFGKHQSFCFCPFNEKDDFTTADISKPSSNDEDINGINNPAMDVQE